MITTVIFDLDGLLIDSEMITYYIDSDLLKRYGHSFEVEDYARHYCGKTSVENMQAYIRNYSLPISVHEGLDFVSRREKEYYQKGVPLKKGARELLQFLKDNQYQIILASSSTRERAVGVLTQNGILQYFDDMVFGAEVKRGKPFPDVFLKACEKANEQPERCLVLEDSEAGIQAADAARIDVICIPDMKRPGEEYRSMTRMVLPSLTEVISFLNNRIISEKNGFILRFARAEDATLYYEQNYCPLDKETARLTGCKEAFTKEEVISFFLRSLEEDDRFFFLIIAPDGRIIGESVLNEIDWNLRCANFRIGLYHKLERGKGIGTWATEATRDFAFEELNLHRLELDVFSFNPRAKAVYLKAGFKREGVLRDAVLDGGQYADDILMSILEDEWRALKG